MDTDVRRGRIPVEMCYVVYILRKIMVQLYPQLQEERRFRSAQKRHYAKLLRRNSIQERVDQNGSNKQHG